MAGTQLAIALPVQVRAAAAELERVVELTGATAAEASHPACVFTGARRCEYRLTWTGAA